MRAGSDASAARRNTGRPQGEALLLWKTRIRTQYGKDFSKKESPELPRGFLAERTGLEPAASGVTGRRYNQLNYRSSGGDGAACNPKVADPSSTFVRSSL